MPAIDTNFISLDSPTTRQFIGVISTLDSAPQKDLMQKAVNSLLKKFPAARQSMVIDRNPKWLETEIFDFEYHYRKYDFDQRLSNLEAASRAFSEELDYQKPPWQLILLDNGRQDPILLFKAHHSMLDGASLFNFMGALGCEKSRIEIKNYSIQNKRAPSQPNKIKSFARLLTATFSKRPKTKINGTNSNQREMFIFSIPKNEFNSVREKFSATNNDLYLAAVAGALRAYHLSKNFSLRSMRAVIPVSLREVPSSSLGNKFTATGVKFPVDKENAEARLQAVTEFMSKLKSSKSFGAYGLLAELAYRLPSQIRKKICMRAALRTNLICTNMPSLKTQITIGGSMVKDMFGIPALLKGHGLGIALSQYKENNCLLVVCDPQIVKQGQQFTNILKQEYKKLINT